MKYFSYDTSPLKDEHLFKKAFSALRDGKKEKIKNIKSPRQRRLSLGAWILFDGSLKKLGLDPKSVILEYGQNGKPLVKGNDFYFNLSHSGEIALAAFDKNNPLGCDIQKTAEYNKNLAERFFHPEETAFLNENPEMFTRLWVLKESYVKATGGGIGKVPFDSFCVRLRGYEVKCYDKKGNPVNACFKIIKDFLPEYEAGVCRLK